MAQVTQILSGPRTSIAKVRPFGVWGQRGRVKAKLSIHSQLYQPQGEKDQATWRCWVASAFTFLSHRKSIQMVLRMVDPPALRIPVLSLLPLNCFWCWTSWLGP